MSYINKIAFCLICKNELTDWEKQFRKKFFNKIFTDFQEQQSDKISELS